MSMRSWPEGCKPLEDLERAGQVSEPPRLGAAPIPEFEAEKAFQAAVEKEARKRGWLCYHTRDSRKSQAGYPDLCMVRSGRLIFAELKVGDNKPSAAQQTWLEELGWVQANIGRPDVVQVFCWYPADWPEIIAKLS